MMRWFMLTLVLFLGCGADATAPIQPNSKIADRDKQAEEIGKAIGGLPVGS